MEEPHIFNMQMQMLSWPWALFGYKFWIILAMSSWERLIWNLVLFFITEHCFAKNALKSSLKSFSLKSVTNLFSWNNGEIRGISALFKKRFNRDQYVSEFLWMLVSLIRSKLDIFYFYAYFWKRHQQWLNLVVIKKASLV